MNQKLFLAVSTIATVMLSLSMYQNFSGTLKVPTSSKAIPSHIHSLYSKWKASYGKIYESPSESVFRLQEFFKTYRLLHTMRAMNPKGIFELNHLSDTTGEEFIAKYANKISLRKLQNPENLKQGAINGIRVDDFNLDLLDSTHPLPHSVDNSGYLAKHHRSQGLTQTCYAFALSNAIGASINLAREKKRESDNDSDDEAQKLGLI